MSKLDIAIDQRKQSVVTTYTDVVSRFDLGAALADDDAASGNQLPIVAFYTEHLGIAVPAIAGATHTFFMCHSLFLCLASLRQSWNFYLFHGRKFLFPGCGSLACNQALAIGNNIVDCEKGEFLAMTPAMANTFLRLVPENN